MLKFTKQENGLLKAQGRHGEYWVSSGEFTTLKCITLTEDGPVVEKLVASFNSVEDAIKEANEQDIAPVLSAFVEQMREDISVLETVHDIREFLDDMHCETSNQINSWRKL